MFCGVLGMSGSMAFDSNNLPDWLGLALSIQSFCFYCCWLSLPSPPLPSNGPNKFICIFTILIIHLDFKRILIDHSTPMELLRALIHFHIHIDIIRTIHGHKQTHTHTTPNMRRIACFLTYIDHVNNLIVNKLRFVLISK